MLKLCLWNSLFKTRDDFCRQFQERKKKKPLFSDYLELSKHPLPYCPFQELYFRAYQDFSCAYCVWVDLGKWGDSKIGVSESQQQRHSTSDFTGGLWVPVADVLAPVTWLSKSEFYALILAEPGICAPFPLPHHSFWHRVPFSVLKSYCGFLDPRLQKWDPEVKIWYTYIIWVTISFVARLCMLLEVYKCFFFLFFGL